MAVGFDDLRDNLAYLFLGCTVVATVVEWVAAKTLERLHHRTWWDYSGHRFNIDGYVCLPYSLLWGVLGSASVLWVNGLLTKLFHMMPVWLFETLAWVLGILAGLRPAGQRRHFAAAAHPSGRAEPRAGTAVPRPVRPHRPAGRTPHRGRLPADGGKARRARAGCGPRRCGVDVHHRVAGGRYRGDDFLPGADGRLDEPFQPGVGPLQHCVGRGAGDGVAPAAPQKGRQRAHFQRAVRPGHPDGRRL